MRDGDEVSSARISDSSTSSASSIASAELPLRRHDTPPHLLREHQAVTDEEPSSCCTGVCCALDKGPIARVEVMNRGLAGFIAAELKM